MLGMFVIMLKRVFLNILLTVIAGVIYLSPSVIVQANDIDVSCQNVPDGKMVFLIETLNGKKLFVNKTTIASEVSEIEPGGIYYFCGTDNQVLWKKDSQCWLGFSNTGRHIVAIHSSEYITECRPEVYDLDGNKIISLANKDEIYSIDVRSRGDIIVAGDMNGIVYFFNNTGEILLKYDTGSGMFSDVAFSKDGKYAMDQGSKSVFIIEGGKVHRLEDVNVRYGIPNMTEDTIVFDFRRSNIKYSFTIVN